MRYDCTLPGLTDCFVEIADGWTRKEVREFFEAKGDAYLDLIYSKMTACYLVCPGTDPITQPFRLTEESLDPIDIRLITWLSLIPLRHVQELGSLGNQQRLALFDSIEMKSDQATLDPQPS